MILFIYILFCLTKKKTKQWSKKWAVYELTYHQQTNGIKVVISNSLAGLPDYIYKHQTLVSISISKLTFTTKTKELNTSLE